MFENQMKKKSVAMNGNHCATSRAMLPRVIWL